MSDKNKDEMEKEKELNDSPEEQLEQELQEEKETVEQEEEELDPLQFLEEKVKEKENDFLRLYAEFDNFKKRTARERIELFSTAGSDTMIALLPVLDDFDRAMEQIRKAEDTKSVLEGIELIYGKLKSTLEQRGLKAMNTKEEAFDPDMHEAITEIPAPSKKLRGKVVDEVEKGYMMGDKIIRFPKVVVGK